MDPDTEKLWNISIENIFDTQGFARSVIVEGSRAYVAAGQSGSQIWDLQDNDLVKDFTGYEEGGTFLEFEDLALIGRDPVNNLLFLSESNQDVKIFHLDETDSLIYRNTIMSARTKDFISFPSNNDQFVMYSADNDDGMKWHFYNLDTTNSFGIEFIEWTPFGGSEIYTPGNTMADAKIVDLDLKNRKIVLSPKEAQIDEEKSLVAKFGEGAAKSGATLKSIFEKALSGGKKKNKKE